ncbi:ADP,ATP carrier protein [Scheffersomyces xylosifermentans]|uniref:ADP,ATP carrier protein n=1 Tax=Scheffersomyces xylosifermentans TaxID=1304137 RepID=UPI00315D48EE
MASVNPSISSYLSDGVGSIIWTTAFAPMNRVKLLIQSQNVLIKQGSLTKKYEGIINCFVRTTRNEGIVALWRGNSADIIKFFPTWAMNHALKEKLNTVFGVRKKKGFWYWIAGNLASEVLLCNATLAFVYPLDYAATRLANDVASASGERKFKGLFDVYASTLTSSGFTGLYRGFGPFALGLTVFRCLHFGLHGTVRSFVMVAPREESFYPSFLISWAITTAATAFCYPFDTISRRMMMNSGEGTRYKNGSECFKRIIAAEGVGSLFRGCGARMLIAVTNAMLISLLHTAIS